MSLREGGAEPYAKGILTHVEGEQANSQAWAVAVDAEADAMAVATAV